MINPTPPKEIIIRGFSTVTAKESDQNLINVKGLERELSERTTVNGVFDQPNKEYPQKMIKVRKNLEDDIRRNSINIKEKRFELNLIFTKELDFGNHPHLYPRTI